MFNYDYKEHKRIDFSNHCASCTYFDICLPSVNECERRLGEESASMNWEDYKDSPDYMEDVRNIGC